MVTKELSRAATEVNIILENSTSDVKNRIPHTFKKFLKDIEDKTYTFNYDTNKRLNEQKISNLTRGIITLIYKDYLCKDREGYLEKLQIDLLKQDKIRQEKYNLDNIFSNKSYDNNINDSKDEVALVEIKNEVWYKKILNFFKRIFLKH